MNCRAVVELPTFGTVFVHGMNRQDGRHLSIPGYDVLSRRQWEHRLFHDQAMFLEPPIVGVEFPLCWSHSCRGLQTFIAVQPHATRTRIEVPYTPELCAVSRGRRRVSERRNELGWDLLESHRNFMPRAPQQSKDGHTHDARRKPHGSPPLIEFQC